MVPKYVCVPMKYNYVVYLGIFCTNWVRIGVVLEYSVLQQTLELKSTDCAVVLVEYSRLGHSTVQYITVQYSTVQCSRVEYSKVECSRVQYSAVECSRVQYSTVQYSRVQ